MRIFLTMIDSNRLNLFTRMYLVIYKYLVCILNR